MDETSEFSARTPLLSVAAYERTRKGSSSFSKINEVQFQRYAVCTLPVVLIHVTVFCERFAFSSVLFNMVLFCKSELNFTSFEATTTCSIFTGIAYVVTPLIGGYVADSLCGRYTTILGSGLLFLAGTVLLFFSAVDFKKCFGYDGEDVRKALFFSSIAVISIASGGIQTNIIPFGAQQVSSMGPRTSQTFCHWYYWARNLGCIASSSVIFLQQETDTFCWGYLLSTLILITGLIVFRAGQRIYKHVPPSESVLKKVVILCWSRRRKEERDHFEVSQLKISNRYDIKHMLQSLPIYGFITVYWMSYAQMSTTLFLQSAEMDLSIGSFNIPPALLIVSNAVMVVLCIPLMNIIIFPLLFRCLRRPTYIQRIGIGMFLAVLALCYAGGLEMVRIQQRNVDHQGTNNVSDVSVFHQAPIFALLGLSEVWTSISCLEFAYTHFPDYMQGLITGLFLMTIGLGSVYSIIITAIIQKAKPDWYPNDSDANGHMECLFFLISGITFVFMLIFILVTRFGHTSAQEDSEPHHSGLQNDINPENA